MNFDMSKEKDIKTNAMRMLERAGVSYEVTTYECDEFTDGVSVAQKLGIPEEQTFKTLVTVGKSGNHYVFVIPVAEELDLKKAAKSVGEKSVEMIHVKDLLGLTGYIRGGCSPVGMKKQFATVIDESAGSFESIYVSGGRIGSQIKLCTDDLVKVTRGRLSDIVFVSDDK